MTYRPQFAFETPAGFDDEQFHYSFNHENVPALATAIPAGVTVRNIILQLQNDAEFVLRAWKVQLGAGATGSTNLYLHVRDPYSFPLSAVPLPLNNYMSPGWISPIGSMLVPIGPETVCPIGGFFSIDLYNPTAGPLVPPGFTLYGVNRRECGRMAA